MGIPVPFPGQGIDFGPGYADKHIFQTRDDFPGFGNFHPLILQKPDQWSDLNRRIGFNQNPLLLEELKVKGRKAFLQRFQERVQSF